MHVNISDLWHDREQQSKVDSVLTWSNILCFLNVVDYVTNENRSNECIYFETNIIFMIFSFA